MPFGSDRALISANTALALYYRLYGTARVGDKIRAWHLLPHIYSCLRPGDSVLDAGCGMGFYSLHLARRFPQAAVQAIDVDPACLDALSRMTTRNRLNNLQIKQGSLEHLDLGRSFDCVLLIDVLEHIEQDIEAVERIAAHLQPGGRLIVHVPQREQLHYLPQEDDLHAWDHVREGYSPRQLTTLLTQAGFEMQVQHNTFGSLGTLAADLDEATQRIKPLWLLLMPLILVLARLDTVSSNPWGNGFLVVARKPAAIASTNIVGINRKG
jgi:SAM-dependent methyltransferase